MVAVVLSAAPRFCFSFGEPFHGFQMTKRKVKMKAKGLRFLGAVVGVMLAGAAFAEPRVEITKAYQNTVGSDVVDITYTISGIPSGEPYFLYITVGAKGRESAECCVEGIKSVANGTATAHIDVKALLGGDACPKLNFFAELRNELKADSVQLWANGPYWATCNVGATKPEEYGYYFWWGDTVGYERNSRNDGWVSVKDGTSFWLSWTTSAGQTYEKNADQLQSAGFTDTSGGNLNWAHDAARAHLGGSWRMPTGDEIQALVDNCTTTWTTRNGVYGRLVTGKGDYASKSIFLPAAGYGAGSGIFNSEKGNYWSSSPDSRPDYAWELEFSSSNFRRNNNNGLRYRGYLVRPVR